MRMDLEALAARIVDGLKADGQLSDVQGELTGERRADRAQIRARFTYKDEQRTFLYHVQREAPIHTVARSMIEDTRRTIPQRIFEPLGARLQPNDVYYPSALGLTPTLIPGQASGPSVQ